MVGSPEPSETPFLKQLVASDRPTRDSALKSLTLYLCSGHAFTSLDLLKLQKGLFYTVHHTANPLPQQRLARSLAALLLSLPRNLFVPWVSAFFETMIGYWGSIPSLRLDKYLYLIRCYVGSSMEVLAREGWEQGLVDEWVEMMMTGGSVGDGDEGPRRCGALDPREAKVGDGLRYHLLDVWVDGLVEAGKWEIGVERGIMRPVEGVAKDGWTKTLRERAKRVLEDSRLKAEAGEVDGRGTSEGEDDAEFEGFD